MMGIHCSPTKAHTGGQMITYQNPNRKQWNLIVEEGYQLRIEWLDFELENAWSNKCKFDFVALVDANGQVDFNYSRGRETL